MFFSDIAAIINLGKDEFKEK